MSKSDSGARPIRMPVVRKASVSDPTQCLAARQTTSGRDGRSRLDPLIARGCLHGTISGVSWRRLSVRVAVVASAAAAIAAVIVGSPRPGIGSANVQRSVSIKPRFLLLTRHGSGNKVIK